MTARRRWRRVGEGERPREPKHPWKAAEIRARGTLALPGSSFHTVYAGGSYEWLKGRCPRVFPQVGIKLNAERRRKVGTFRRNVRVWAGADVSAKRPYPACLKWRG